MELLVANYSYDNTLLEYPGLQQTQSPIKVHTAKRYNKSNTGQVPGNYMFAYRAGVCGWNGGMLAQGLRTWSPQVKQSEEGEVILGIGGEREKLKQKHTAEN